MKNNLKKIIYIGAVTIALSSCGKKLDVLPPDLVLEENALKDWASIERGLTGVYGHFNGSRYDNEIYANALYSDEAMLPTENNTGRGVIAYRWQSDPGIGEITNAWNAYYFSIDRVNRVLAATNALATSTSTEEATKKRASGELLALRAFAHLQLLINFAEGFDAGSKGIPYMTEPIISKPSRLTVGEVFTKIREDLTSAEQLLSTGAGTNVSRITLPAVYAIQARTALYAKDWATAISASTKAINAIGLASRADYPNIWLNTSNAEVIFKFKRSTGEARLGDTFFDRTQQKIIYAPSKELFDLFTTEDIRLASTIRDFGGGRLAVGKYRGGDASQPNLADIMVFRTAEMYLIRAEAYAESSTPNLTAAAADLNALRAARITGYTNEVFPSKDALISAIITERFKELAFEAHRMADLRRRKLPVTRLPEDAINALGAVTLNPTDRQYYFPIPSTEILANENLEQNSGYIQ